MAVQTYIIAVHIYMYIWTQIVDGRLEFFLRLKIVSQIFLIEKNSCWPSCAKTIKQFVYKTINSESVTLRGNLSACRYNNDQDLLKTVQTKEVSTSAFQL